MRSTTSIGCPSSSTPSAYRAQPATTAADRRISPPVARFSRTTGKQPLGQPLGAVEGQLLAAIRRNREWCYDLVGTAAANGHAGFSDYRGGGARERAERTAQWYLAHEPVQHSSEPRRPRPPCEVS
ncbi:hypothetical protein [Geodermatophilus sp. CPCC 205761]|uniref:hypothetical protein n=1 Tax=Geodermatophilus sp. CPCC 205761 TaxID=2936597 RepID=UPI003EE8B072